MSAKGGSAGPGSWLSAHGRLWYDDRWYRLAWIAWPQAIALFLFATLWLHQPGQGFIPLHGYVGLYALTFPVRDLHSIDARRHSRSQMLLIEAFFPCAVRAADQRERPAGDVG